MHRPQRNRGFSLLELMVVITVIALLAMVSIPSYLRYLQKASLAEAVSIFGNYKTALGIYWNTKSELPQAGSTLTASPASLPFGSTVTTNLPDSIESILLSSSGNGVLITIVVQNTAFSTLSQANRELSLGAKINGSEIIFECGNFSANAAVPAGLGFPDRSILPSGCNYNGVGVWLSS